MRYCPHCGSELRDTQKFCSSCGAKCAEECLPTGTSNKGKYYRRKKSKLLWLIIAASVILITVICVSTLQNHVDNSVQMGDSGNTTFNGMAADENTDDVQKEVVRDDNAVYFSPPVGEDGVKYSIEVIQSISNNRQNTYIACDGDWMYNGSAGLNKIPLTSEGAPTKVSEKYTPGAMFCLGDKLYMSINMGSVSYVSLDDLQADPICPVAGARCFQTDGMYYYVDYPGNINAEKGVYRVSVENPREYELLFDMEPNGILLQGEYLYVINSYSMIYDENKNLIENPNFGVWRINLDGSNSIRITDKTSNYMIFGNDRIYWQDDDYSLYSTALDGTDRQDYEVQFDFSLNVNDKYIFYLDKKTSNLYRMDLDGQNNTCLVKHRCSDFGLWGDWLVYENLDDYEYYKINIVDNIHYKIEWP